LIEFPINMKIAVTGASGHVGANLCRMLIDRGHEVKALIHNSTKGIEDLGLEFVYGEINSEADLRKLCSGCEVVFHLAACISIRKNDKKCRTINTESCITLLKAAKNEGVRKIIHFSSIHAYEQEPLDIELDETRSLALEGGASYERSKAMGQKIMTEASSPQLEVVVLNPTAILGPNDFQPSLLGSAVIRFFRGQNPSLLPGGYNWVDVRDVCSAAINAIELGVPGESYLLGGSWQSLKTMAATIEKLGGHKAPWLYLPMSIAYLGAIFLNLHATITKSIPLYTAMSLETLKHGHKKISSRKAAKALAFKARPFEETMADTITWFKENKYI
jgi:dihydroflavonol-4-reductase